MKNIKQEIGITLIALVITIIVLLILAGVTIATLTGENGILKQASSAQEETKKAQYKEMIEIVITQKEIEVSEDPIITKPFIQIVKEAIEAKQWQWVEEIHMVDDELDEVLEATDGTHILVYTKEGYEIIIEIDNALKIGKVVSIEKTNKEKWTVTFDLDGGEGEIAKNKQVRAGWSIKLPMGENLSKTDHKFVGWSITRQGEVLPEKFTPEKQHTTLYAVWSKDTVTITLKANGAEQTDIVQNVIRGHDFIITAPFERNGYELAGWAYGNNEEIQYSNGQKIQATQDMTLYAKWAGKILISLSLTNASNATTSDLTSGTKINVSVASPSSEISNLSIKIGNVTVYNNTETGNSLNKNISINSLSNLVQLTSFTTYKIEAIATNKDKKQATAIKEGITDYTIKSYKDLVAFSNLVNSGNNLSDKTVYLINDLILDGKELVPIGYTNENAFRGTFDGGYHIIKGLKIYTNYVAGLFGYNAGTIENLIVTNFDVSCESPDSTFSYARGNCRTLSRKY